MIKKIALIILKNIPYFKSITKHHHKLNLCSGNSIYGFMDMNPMLAAVDISMILKPFHHHLFAQDLKYLKKNISTVIWRALTNLQS